MAEEDMITTISSVTPYVETDEKALECFFRSLEFVNAMYVGEGLKVPMPKLSDTTHAGIKQLSDKEARVGKRLGKRLQGMLMPIAVTQKRNRFELGYKSDRQERQRFLKEKRQKRIASFFGKKGESAKMIIPPLSFSFLFTGFINPEII